MTLQTGLIILSIILFIWDARNAVTGEVKLKVSSLAWATLIASYIAGQF